MPFAPSILEEKANDYLINPKNFFAPYMIMAFPTKLRAHTDLIAALHPYDLSCRPQVVRKDWNPGYYRLLKRFEEITGVGNKQGTGRNTLDTISHFRAKVRNNRFFWFLNFIILKS